MSRTQTLARCSLNPARGLHVGHDCGTGEDMKTSPLYRLTHGLCFSLPVVRNAHPHTPRRPRHALSFDGVVLAAIQGLNQKLEEARAESAQLKRRLEQLESRLESKK